MAGQLENEDHRWLRACLGGTGIGHDLPYLVRPSLETPEFLAPLTNPAVAAASVHRSHDGRTARQRLETLAAMGLARLGLLGRAPGTRCVLAPFALVDELADRLGESELHAAITIGPRRRNRKPVLQLIRPDGSVAGFAKIGWSPFTKDLVSNEATWLRAVDGRLPSGLLAPRVVFERTTSADVVVVTSAVVTPWRARRSQLLSPELVTALARCLGSTVVRVADATMVDTWAGVVGPGAIDIERLLDRHGDRSIELGLWHGDLTPWNTATSAGTSSVWDWEFASDDRPVGFDLLHQRFEQVRRHRRHDEADALAAVIQEAPRLLAALDQPVDTVVDLYLAELIVRESRLAGEGWDPQDLGPLEAIATDQLSARLR